MYQPYTSFTVTTESALSFPESSLRIAIPGHPGMIRNYGYALRQAGADYQVITDTSHLTSFDALLLPGGGDMDPSLYGRKNCGSRQIDLELDLLQLKAADHFLSHRKPILGICKGMQVIHVALGGRLCQDLREASSHIWKEEDQYHDTTVLPESFLFHLFHTRSLLVNSAHHQSIEPAQNGLHIIQYAMDGVPEGVVHESLPVIGLQWHPERMPSSLPNGTKISSGCCIADGSAVFSYFLSLCKSSF